MTVAQIKKLETIIGKIETLQNEIKENDLLQIAKDKLLQLLRNQYQEKAIMPKTKTMLQCFIIALTNRGEKQVKRTNKWVMFTRSKMILYDKPSEGFYYIGKSGSLRVGKTVADSVPMSDKVKKMLLDEANSVDKL